MAADDKAGCRRLPYHDTGWSWVVAAACGWCFFWTMIVNRCGGIVFVTMISEMGASRETASWPFSLLGAVSNIFAVVSGVLIRRLPLRTVSILGSLLVATGVLLCAAVYNITAIIISLGVITSIGQGLIFPSNMVAINSYFQKYRASGSGISYVGGTLVSFVFPPILLYLNETYGLRGTLLIVGGFTLNAVAGSLLISRPQERRPKARTVEEPLTPLEKVDEPPTEKQTKPLSTFRKELSFFKRPMYYVIVVTGVVYAYDLVMFNVTIVDYGIGHGHSKWEAALLLSCYGCGDLIGRIFSGQLSDRKICRRRHVMAASFLVLSGSFVSLVHSHSMGLLGTTSFLFGVASGSIIILFSVLLVEYFGLEKLPMTIGFHCLVNGLATFPRPLLIGHYRDRGKSYESLYALLAAVSFGTGVVWTIECFLQWLAGRKAKQADNSKGQPTSCSA
ncbi:unnamed protein product [Ixodes persulcatus]